jgi:hypothetical protein
MKGVDDEAAFGPPVCRLGRADMTDRRPARVDPSNPMANVQTRRIGGPPASIRQSRMTYVQQ